MTHIIIYYAHMLCLTLCISHLHLGNILWVFRKQKKSSNITRNILQHIFYVQRQCCVNGVAERGVGRPSQKSAMMVRGEIG